MTNIQPMLSRKGQNIKSKDLKKKTGQRYKDSHSIQAPIQLNWHSKSGLRPEDHLRVDNINQ